MAIKFPNTLGTMLQKISLGIQIIIVFIVTLLILSLLIPFLAPIYLFRFILFKLAPYIRPNLGKMLSTRSAMFASDDLYNKPQCNLLAYFVSEGDVDLPRIRKVVQNNLVDVTFPNGQLKNPELQQYVTQWIGFSFWKNDKEFKTEEHVRLFDLSTEADNIKIKPDQKPNSNSNNNEVTESRVAEIMSDLSTLPFKEGKSPWDIILVPNFVSDLNDDGKLKNALIFRWHHCLMDGFGMLKLFSGMSTLDLKTVSQSRSIDRNRDVDSNSDGKGQASSDGGERIRRRPGLFSIVSTIIAAPYVILKTSIESADPVSSNTWHLPEKQLAKQWKSRFADTKTSTDFVKEIKDHYEVSFSAVLLTGITGALRKFMLANKSRKIPDFIHAGIPFPFKGHPDKLRNFWSICTVKLPIREKSSVKRLHHIEKKLRGMKTSPAPLLTFLIMPLIGGLFRCMIRQLMINRNTTVIVSTMPGPQTAFNNYKGGLGLQLGFFVSLGAGNAGIGFSTLSYNGTVRMGATLDTELFSNIEQLQEIANGIHNELVILKDLIEVEV